MAGRPRKDIEEKTKQRLNKFIPSILTWYQNVFRRKPAELDVKDWLYLKYHISRVCLNKIVPDKKFIEGEFEASAQLTIKEEKTLKDIEKLSPEQKRQFYAKLAQAANIIEAAKPVRKK